MQIRTFSALRANPIQFGFVTVRVGSKDGPLATGLKKEDGSDLSNPFPIPKNGRPVFQAPNGNYWLNLVGPGFNLWEEAQFLDVADVLAVGDAKEAAEAAAESAAEAAAEAEGKVLQFKEQELGYFTHLIGDGDSLVSFLEAGGSVDIGYVARVNAVDDSAEVTPSTWKCTATDAELPGGATPGELYEGKLYVQNEGDDYYVFEYVGEGRVDEQTGEVVTLREDLASGASGLGSRLVRFLQAGVGAVLRWVEDKLRETISVKDFGAVGDGVADDTAAIQAAIDFVAGKGAGIVHVPEGRYLLKQKIYVRRGVSLRGVVTSNFTERFPFDMSNLAGSVFLIDWGAGGSYNTGTTAAIEQHPNTEISGIVFYYPSQVTSGTPTSYSPTIWVTPETGPNVHRVDFVRINNCHFVNSYAAIDIWRFNSRIYVSDITGSPLRSGLRLNYNTDFSEFSNINWQPGYLGSSYGVGSLRDWVRNNCEGFTIGRADWPTFRNCTAWDIKVGVVLTPTDNGIPDSVSFIDCKFDACSVACVWFNGAVHEVKFVGCSFTAFNTLTMVGSNVIGYSLGSSYTIDGLIMSTCHVFGPTKTVFYFPSFAQKGKNFVFSGCNFKSINGQGVTGLFFRWVDGLILSDLNVSGYSKAVSFDWTCTNVQYSNINGGPIDNKYMLENNSGQVLESISFKSPARQIIRYRDGTQFISAILPGPTVPADGATWTFPAAFWDNNAYSIVGTHKQLDTPRIANFGTPTRINVHYKGFALDGGAIVPSSVSISAQASGNWRDPDVFCEHRFYELERRKVDGAWQAVAFDGEYFYVTATGLPESDPIRGTAGNTQWGLRKLNRDFVNVTNQFTTNITSGCLDTRNFAEGLHTQVNGLYYDKDSHILYVCANNYWNMSSGVPNPFPHDMGWVILIDPDTLEQIEWHYLGIVESEALARWNGFWWHAHSNTNELVKYDDSFTAIKSYPLPTPYTGDGFHWQGLFVKDDVFYINDHGTGDLGSSRLRAVRYDANDDAFKVVAFDLGRPNEYCKQGIYYDQERDLLFWAERRDGGPAAEQGSYIVITRATNSPSKT